METWPLDSRTAREWISHKYYTAHGAAPRAQALADATATLCGIARYDGEPRDVHLRTARTAESVIHDICDRDWRAVTITADGWTVGAAPVIYRRPVAARALPEPQRGGTVGDVIDRLELPMGDARHVIVWTVAAIMGDA
ncbi:ATP-binding protein, partial [mine drainage metagenome]